MSKIKGRSGGPSNLMKKLGSGEARKPQNPMTKSDLEMELRAGWIGLIALLAAIVMLFASFSSSFVDRVLQGNLLELTPPPALWVSTAVILLSSMIAERARAAARKGNWQGVRVNLGLTLAAGLVFVAAQYVAWMQLSRMGIYLQSNPHSSFFYFLSIMHVLHVLGGLVWLILTLVRVTQMSAPLRLVDDPGRTSLTQSETREKRLTNSVGLCVTYWHFIDVLWIYLFVLLFAL